MRGYLNAIVNPCIQEDNTTYSQNATNFHAPSDFYFYYAKLRNNDFKISNHYSIHFESCAECKDFIQLEYNRQVGLLSRF